MQRTLTATIAALTLACATPVSTASGLSFSELRFGVLAHDPGLFGDSKEDGIDLNAEAYFQDLEWLGGEWDVRPSFGASLNLSGDTSKIYAALNVTGPLAGPVFVEAGAGLALHTGELETADPDRKELGSRVLFHLSASAGVMVTETVSVSAFVDHVSNANLADENEGYETVGIRVGIQL